MIKILISTVLGVLWVAVSAFGGEFTVTKVYDGDSITIEGHGITAKVRLVGIDAPERKRGKKPAQPYSEQSREYLSSLILNKSVSIKGFGLDPYNRVLGEVLLGEKNINAEMLSAGLVEVYRGRSPKAFSTKLYLEIEDCSKLVKRGVWALGDHYISPFDYRKLKP